jgi:adenosylcobinamide-GDP ribazoletransferase
MSDTHVSTATRQRPLRDAALAITLLTVLPSRETYPHGEKTQVAAWFPLVGLLYGSIGYAIVKLGGVSGAANRAPFVLAAVVVLAWALFNRFLHHDGLADVADGYWGSHDRERRLEIMSDSRTGAFGATAVAIVSILEVVSLAAIIAHPHELPVLLAPVFSRFSATAGSWLGTPARPGGLGRSVIGHPTGLGLAIGVVPLAAVCVAWYLGFGNVGVALATFGLMVAFAVPHFLSERFGGITGDVLGASVLITEALFLAAIALAL